MFTHDDFFDNSFDIYGIFMVNGRYAGNSIQRILTHSNLLKTIVMALVNIFIIFFISSAKDTKHQNNKLEFGITILLFLLMPISMVRQAVVWTSGFCNYVIPTIFILYFIYINFNYNDIIKSKSKSKLIIFFVSGIISSLFMENITIYLVLMSAFFVLYIKLNYNIISYIDISVLVGNIVGAVLMFSSPAYRSVIKGEDQYRQTVLDLGIFNQVIKNIKIISLDGFFRNFILNVFIFLLIVAVCYSKRNMLKSLHTKLLVLLCLFFDFIFCVFSLMISINLTSVSIINTFNKLFGQNIKMRIAVLLLYFFSILVLSIVVPLDRKKKIKILFYLFSIVTILAPLFLVSPVGPRNMYIIYVFQIMYGIEILSELKLPISSKKFIFLLTTFLSVFLWILLLYIYSSNYFFNKKRVIKAEFDAKHSDTIVVKRLPYSDFLWVPEPVGKYDEELFINYYNLPKNTRIKVK
jgi:hypothetical protein